MKEFMSTDIVAEHLVNGTFTLVNLQQTPFIACELHINCNDCHYDDSVCQTSRRYFEQYLLSQHPELLL